MKTLFAAISIAVLLAGCGAGADNSLEPLTVDATLVHSKIATVAVAIATAGEGHGFFDNFLACARRGVIDYRNTERGRNATLSGCDVGDGVVLDGTVEVRWTSTGADRTRISAIDVVGPIHVRGNGDVGDVAVRNVAFSQPFPLLANFDFGAARVVIANQSVPLDTRATVSNVFNPSMTIDAISNAGESLDALTEADLKRLAYDAVNAIAGLLFDETLEVARGDHVHNLTCGTTRVTVDRARNLPRLDNTWNSCAANSVFISGTYSSEWSAFDASNGRLAMVLNGAMTFGGGVPRFSADRIEWTASGIFPLPGTATISGRIVRGAQQRPFSFTMVVDD